MDFRRVFLTLVLVGASLWCTALVAAAYGRSTNGDAPEESSPAIARPADEPETAEDCSNDRPAATGDVEPALVASR